MRILLTCEHAGNSIPVRWRGFFRGRERLLASHRGYDPGALALGRALARRLGVPLHFHSVSRLLVDVNRSPGHRDQFSEVTRGLPEAERRAIVERCYLPHRDEVTRAIGRAARRSPPVIHLGVHSFTPVRDGVRRTADFGLLYDPRRPLEKRVADALRTELLAATPHFVVRRNYPYLGRSDGFTTWLRRRFDDARYAGIELEVNQRFPRAGGAAWRRRQRAIVDAVAAALAGFDAAQDFGKMRRDESRHRFRHRSHPRSRQESRKGGSRLAAERRSKEGEGRA